MTACTDHRKPVSWAWRQSQTGDQRSVGLWPVLALSLIPLHAGGGISDRVTPATRVQDRPMALSKTLRFEIFKRDKFTCQYCGRRPPDIMLEADHIVAVAEGGGDGMKNLTTSCFDCNRGKGAHGLGHVAPALDEHDRMAAMQEMMERKALIEMEIAQSRAFQETEDNQIAAVHDWWAEAYGEGGPVTEASRWEKASGGLTCFPPPDSVRRILRRLPLEEVREAVNITAAKFHIGNTTAWRYFFGICWRKIRGTGNGQSAVD